MTSLRIPILAVLVCALLVSPGSAIDPIKPKPKVTNWLPLWEVVSAKSRKDKKYILAYFSGSDWEPFTQKLDKEVLNTDMFRDWADKNVILFRVDYPKDAKQSANIKTQNEQLRQRYGIVKIPQFILMDFSGNLFNRAYWDQAKLRDEEPKGEPKAFIAYLDNAIKNKPPDEELLIHKNLTEALAYGKKHYLSTVMLVNHDQVPRTLSAKDDLLHSQEFVKFMNRNVSFVSMQWPFDSDTSPEATFFRQFVATQQISDTAPLQLIVVDMQTNKVNFRLTAVNPSRSDQIINMVEEHLPKPDYNGGWITDAHLATSIARTQKRYIFMCFTSMNHGDYSKKIFNEIFNTPEFVQYARKKLVTLQLDFPDNGGGAPAPGAGNQPAAPDVIIDPSNPPPDAPVAPAPKPATPAPATKPAMAPTTQPAGLIAQNKELQEKYNIRGYPSIIVLNPQGQKIGDAKYMKDGPAAFIKQLDAAVKNDEERRAFLAGDQ